MLNFKKYDFKHFSYSLVGAVILLMAVSVFCLFHSDGFGMAKRQAVGAIAGVVVMLAISLIDYHLICKFTPLYYLTGVVMLFLVKFTSLGVDHGTNAFRWLNVRVTEIQPSELVKIFMILVMAVFFTKFKNKMNRWSTFFISGIIMGIPTFLILIQTDLSSSMVCMFIFTIMIFVSGLSLKIIMMTLSIGVPVFGLLFWYVLQPYQVILTKVQRGRILSFLNPEEYELSGRFQQVQSVRAIAAGKVLGKALLNNEDGRRYKQVYVNESDFIFSVLAEELGFIGSVIVIALFTFIAFKCIMIAKNSADHTGKMIAIGVSAMIMFQTFVNIGVATELLPNTGLPLPFMSYGLSSLLSNLLAVALVLNVSVQPYTKRGLSFSSDDSEIYF